MKRVLLGLCMIGTLFGPLFAGDATGRIAVGGAGGWGDLLARKDDKKETNGDLFGSAWMRLGLSHRNEIYIGYDSIQLKVKNDSSENTLRIRPVTVGLWHSFSSGKK
ncbi:MAG: hypothetical protein IPN90_02320 [Elusimicrobia bacterium]|nr:hypothetical protein [Elusimicrobiota bacterium]